MMEGTPLYIGIPYVQNITYKSDQKSQPDVTLTMGGFVEPFAAGTAGPVGDASSAGADSGADGAFGNGATVNVQLPAYPSTVAAMAAASSAFYGPAVVSGCAFAEVSSFWFSRWD
jgi:hypothetical protein